jgi:hypothetical protein
MHPQSCESPSYGNFETLTWESRDKKTIWMWPPWRGTKCIIRGSLVCPSCPWLVLAPKVLQLCINHFVLVSCRSVWMIEACHFFLVSSWSSNMPLYPFIVLRTKERAPTPCSSVIFNLGLTFESLKKLGVRHLVSELWWSSIPLLESPDGTKEVP